jgi:2-polyprenyl-3-methyl-5-hydroxy-6-metoxy-1,4-benzoquinol methylase
MLKPPSYFKKSRTEMLPYVPSAARRILDVGCGAGGFSAQLRRPGREIWGAEYDPDAAQAAGGVLDKVLCGPIESILPQLPARHFDCVVFNDVLEHLVDPFQLLRDIQSYLTSDAVIVASIPNVRYLYHLREVLVDRQWRYRNYGILDRTHLRFFTKLSIIDMFVEAGYSIDCIQGINPQRSWKFSLLNAVLLNHIEDMQFEQFACVARRTDSVTS